MKKILNIIISIFAFFFLSTNVLAASCTGSVLNDLQNKANNIKVNYEIVETKQNVNFDGDNEFKTSKEPNIIKKTIRVTIYNLTKELLVEESNSVNDNIRTYHDNGNITFETDNIKDIITYTFKIYSNVDSCDKTLIKTISFVKPKRNKYADFQVCIDNPDVPVCQEYITKDVGVTEDALFEMVENYKNNKKSSSIIDDNSAERKNVNNNSRVIYFVIPGIALLIGILTYLVISRRRGALK